MKKEVKKEVKVFFLFSYNFKKSQVTVPKSTVVTAAKPAVKKPVPAKTVEKEESDLNISFSDDEQMKDNAQKKENLIGKRTEPEATKPKVAAEGLKVFCILSMFFL